MNKLFSATILFLSISTSCFALPFTYDDNNQGWQQAYIGRPDGARYDKLYPTEGADWQATGGHIEGHIYQTAQGIDKRAYYLGYNASSNFLGDLHGMMLVTNIWSTDNWRTVSDSDVYARWVIAKKVGTDQYGNPWYNMFVSKRDASIKINNLNGWETHSIVLEESNFFRWPNYAANTQNFSELLSDYDSFGLYLFSGSDDLSNYNGGSGTWDNQYYLLHYGAYSNNGDPATWALDNFRAEPVPEPSTIMLFVTGFAGFAVISRFRKK